MIKKFWTDLTDFFSDQEDPEEPVYDPTHFAAMIVIVIFTVGVLFWLLWTLLVFGGGLFGKIVPAIRVLFTGKTLEDYGWVGYPFELGIFEGFVGNIIALLLAVGLIFGLWWLHVSTVPPPNTKVEIRSPSNDSAERPPDDPQS